MNDEVQAQGIPVEVLKRKESSWFYLIAVIALAVMGVLAMIGALVLAWGGKEVPSIIEFLAGGAVTGLVALIGQNQAQA